MTLRHWIPVVLLAYSGLLTSPVSAQTKDRNVDRVAGEIPAGTAAPDRLEDPVSTDGLAERDRSALLEMAESWALSTAQTELGVKMPEVVASNVAPRPLSGELVFVVKLVDASGEIYELTFSRQGHQVSLAELVAEAEAEVLQRGKIHETLAAELALTGAGESVEVLVWCRIPEGLEPPRPADFDVRSTRSVDRNRDQPEAAAEVAVAPSPDPALETLMLLPTREVAAYLESIGCQPELQAGAPLIYVRLTSEQIQAVAGQAGVLELYANPTNEQHLAVARQVTRANVVNGRGVGGQGVRVGVVEVGGGVATNHPLLRFTQYLPFAALDDHAAGVAGVIGSRHNQHRGIAPDAQLLIGGSARGVDNELFQVMNVSREWGARVINNSWGSTPPDRRPRNSSRFCDHMVWWHGVTVVVSAGNNGQRSDAARGLVGDPGLFYNGLSVGAVDNRQTAQTLDDRMAPYSSYVNPYSLRNDRQKPDLVAPGGWTPSRHGIVTTTNRSPFLGQMDGTSFASPVVAGGAALLMQRSPQLREWPEAVKSILMATSLQNIEGDARLSNLDGAGSVQLDRADDAARGAGNSGWAAMGFGTNRGPITDVLRVNLVAGKRTRIVIAWNQNTDYALYESQPCADLDLQILRPNGSLRVGSYSWDNTFEIVDFTPDATGMHTIRVRRSRMDMSPGALGIAWYQVP